MRDTEDGDSFRRMQIRIVFSFYTALQRKNVSAFVLFIERHFANGISIDMQQLTLYI